MTSMELHNIMEESDKADQVDGKSSDRFETPSDLTPTPSRKGSEVGEEVVSNGYDNEYSVEPSAPLPESDHDSGPSAPHPDSSDRYLLV